MSAERLTSPEERDEIRAVIDAAFAELEMRGLSRGQIAAGAFGYAIGVYIHHAPAETVLQTLDQLRSLVVKKH